MTIKEVEQTVGITKANIRFYEKEGLLEPTRNTDNNYRDYTEKDVLLLKKIKLLRGLGISLFEIRTLTKQPDALYDILQNRLLEIELEKQQLKETEDACRYILKEHIDFDSLSETLVDEQTTKLKDRIALALTEDLTEKTMSGKRLMDTIGILLLCSLAATALISNLIYHFNASSFTYISSMSDLAKQNNIYDLLLYLWPLLCIATAIMIGMTAKPWIHFILFLVLSASQGLEIICFLSYKNIISSHGIDAPAMMSNITLFICIACIYTIIIWLLSRFTKGYLKHWFWSLIPAALFIAAALMIYAPRTNSLLYPGIFFLLFALYIALRWYYLTSEVETCNRYYAITSAIQIINVIAFFVSARGSGVSWRRGDKEYH